MIRRRVHIFSLFIALVFINPTIITSIHVLFYHSADEHHYHLKRGYSDQQLELCHIDHFAFEAFFLKPIFIYQPVCILLPFKKVFEKYNRLFYQTTYLLKGRSPPLREI